MSRRSPTTLLRYLALIGLAFWMGGFTFYAGVVIHVGHHVFGTMRETGFLTQQVTLWLNRSGAIVLTILLVNLLLTRKQIAPRWWFAAAATLAIMIAIHIALFQLHPLLDAFLDASTQTIRDHSVFHAKHLVYMNLSTTQWAAALIHLWSVLILWRKSDQQQAPE